MIYLIECDQYYKIGYAKDIDQRMRQYNTHNPNYKLIDSKEGTRKDEEYLHTLCEQYKIKTEWYLKCSEILNIWKNYNHLPNDEMQSFYLSNNFYYIFFKLKSDTAKNLLMYMFNNCVNDTNTINLSNLDRKEICELFGISNNSLTNTIKKLKDLNLISGSGGRFTINPKIFWKGEMKVRNQLLQNEDIQISFKLGEQ